MSIAPLHEIISVALIHGPCLHTVLPATDLFIPVRAEPRLQGYLRQQASTSVTHCVN